MKKIILITLVFGWLGCRPQPADHKRMENNTPAKTTHPLLCDIETGACETPGETGGIKADMKAAEKPVKIIYFTDPICSSCWGIEPQLRKLKLEYGNAIEIDYRMGGLLPDWSYNSGGISKPSDVAHHWDEVSLHYEMPIDGDVWLEDPLHSSYPPSVAFKAAQMQDKEKAIRFLRRLREMVFLEKKNITKWEYIQQAAKETGLDTIRLKADFEGKANDLFKEDLQLARQMGVRGFPTLFFADTSNNQKVVYGSRPYPEYENAVTALFPQAKKQAIDTRAIALFDHYPTLTTKEFSTLAGLSRQEAEQVLAKLLAEKYLTQTLTKNGVLWKH